ncbi:50S ribosomal protein L3 [bacterium]|nr:50S ribosomal protein L3 [bacterium]
MNGLIGKKIGMTQIFDATGNVIPVTIVEAGPCLVTQVKTVAKDGYQSAQLGFGSQRRNITNKPLTGHFKKAGIEPVKIIKEFNFAKESVPSLGQEIKVDIFTLGEKVNISGTTKGKGFAGVVKRHGFGGVGDKTHGQSDRERAPGSIGASSYPSRVIKGMRMAGHAGNARETVQGLKIVKIDAENNLLFIAGSVPGPNNGILEIRKAK